MTEEKKEIKLLVTSSVEVKKFDAMEAIKLLFHVKHSMDRAIEAINPRINEGVIEPTGDVDKLYIIIERIKDLVNIYNNKCPLPPLPFTLDEIDQILENIATMPEID